MASTKQLVVTFALFLSTVYGDVHSTQATSPDSADEVEFIQKRIAVDSEEESAQLLPDLLRSLSSHVRDLLRSLSSHVRERLHMGKQDGVSRSTQAETRSEDLLHHNDLSTSKRSTLHLLSHGRSGSCFLGKLLNIQGLPYVFEPDNDSESPGWGLWSSSNIDMQARLSCLYTCKGCAGLVKDEGKMEQICGAKPKQIAIKTVGTLSDWAQIGELPESLIQQAKYILLLRDPRAMHHTNVKNERVPLKGPINCNGLLLQYLSAKEFAVKFPHTPLRAIFFEHWSQEVETFVPELFAWMGLEMNDEVRRKAVSSAKGSAFEWTESDDKQTYIDLFNKAPYCMQYLELTGYPLVPTKLEDYYNLRDKFEQPISDKEKKLLLELRPQFSMLSTSTSVKALRLSVELPKSVR